MTLTTAVDLISGRLGQRTGLQDRIITEMKLAQRTFEYGATLPWFLVKKGDVTVDAATEALPTDFLRFDDTKRAWLLVDGVLVPFPKEDLTVLQADENLQGTGTPQAFSIVGTSMYIFPTPDKAYTATLYYFAMDVEVDTVAENNWLKYAPDVLVSEVGFQIARYLRDRGAMELFGADKTAALRRLWVDATAREEQGRDAYLGGDN